MKIKKSTISLAMTILGVIGVGTTSILSVKCSKKAEQKETKKEKIIAYAPAIASGALTVGCIVGSHHVSRREIAALTASCGYLAANRDKIERKIKKEFGEGKAKEIRQEAAREAVMQQQGDYIEVTGYGNMLFCEYQFGRKFYCSLERVEWAEKQINHRFHSGEYVSMNDFYELLNLEKCKAGEDFGWPAEDSCYDYSLESPIEFNNIPGYDENENPIMMIDIATRPIEFYYDL